MTEKKEINPAILAEQQLQISRAVETLRSNGVSPEAILAFVQAELAGQNYARTVRKVRITEPVKPRR